MQTIKLLMHTHFPDSTPATSHVIPCTDTSAIHRKKPYKLTNSIINREKVEWAIMSFEPFKAPGVDDIIPKMLQISIPYITDPIVGMFKASIILNHIPTRWRKVNVIFIPKPGKDPAEPKSYRPISLLSFLLKTLEKLLDIHIRESLDLHPISEMQFAYCKGKSTELAAHYLVSRLEKAKSQKQIAMVSFMDIQGAFDNTTFESIDTALQNKEIAPPIRRWITSMLTDI